jgi:cytidyltransferase-like protein
MKTVLTVGVFDYFHLGHLRLFKNIKKQVGAPCRLIVAMQDGDYITKFKPDAEVLYSTDERKEILESIKEIDEVIIYKVNFEKIREVDFDIFAAGADQTGEHFQKCFEFCRENGKQIMPLPRTEGISSTDIKSRLAKEFNNQSEKNAR